MEEENKSAQTAPRTMRMVFGIIMVVVYLGMATLMVIGFFDSLIAWAWARWAFAVLFAVYGVFRGYRLYKGLN